MMSLLETLKSSLSKIGTVRFDSNGLHRSWKYDSSNSEEKEALQQFALYAKKHKVPQSKLSVRTTNTEIQYNTRQFLYGWTYKRYLHYFIYPDWASEHRTENKNIPYWSITFQKAKELDPEHHSRCSFYRRSCEYCNGPNENKIG